MGTQDATLTECPLPGLANSLVRFEAGGLARPAKTLHAYFTDKQQLIDIATVEIPEHVTSRARHLEHR
jgi:hypothetical protein